tara:strand:- start:585 stop:1214 length:630 start_codon:yes stop_codon:yes gene_type:complete
LGKLNTISDSKEAFFKEFPYVIPHVFRRVADEILVELNLLSHQQNFKPNYLFSLGLTKAFKDLTTGYRPQNHVEKLFNALCHCNNIDPENINSLAEEGLKSTGSITLEQIKKYISDKTTLNDNIKKIFKDENKLYNRLKIIGIYKIILEITKKEDQEDKSINEDMSKSLAESLGFQSERVSKDLNVYISSVEKLKQSLELIELLNKKKK